MSSSSDRKAELTREGASIVFVGSFNPTIFQPAWFAHNELVASEEAEAAEIGIVHPEIVQFALRWLLFEADRERITLKTTESDPSGLMIRDLALGMFILLSHTPVTAVGLNFHRHYRLPDETAWHNFGHRLVPPANWQSFLPNPGMLAVDVQGARENPDDPGYIRVRVEPSLVSHPGVHVAVNDHYEFAPRIADAVPVGEAVVVLDRYWGRSQEAAQKIFDGLIEANA